MYSYSLPDYFYYMCVTIYIHYTFLQKLAKTPVVDV